MSEMLAKVNVSFIYEPSEQVYAIGNEAIVIYTWVVYSTLCQIISIFGIITNSINIICFVKQGFAESINISLLALTFSDLGSLTTMVWTCISLTPAMLTADLPFDPFEVMYLTSGIAHLSFTRVSSCITAMITLERCLCIIAPLQIKSIITPKRTTVITICVFIIFFFSSSAVYCVNRLASTFSSFRNKTIIGLVSSSNRQYVEKISSFINVLSIPVISFAIIIVCTTVLSVKLKRQITWRVKNITHAQVDKTSSRNQKTAKMVLTISTLFIICFIPVSVAMIVFGMLPGMSLQGMYVNLLVMIGGLGYVLESINSSVNIFIYYHMSSNYREKFVKYFLS